MGGILFLKIFLATAHQVQNNLFHPTSALISSHTGFPRFLKHASKVPASGPLHRLFCLPRASFPAVPANVSFSSTQLYSNVTSERPSLTLHLLWLPPSPGELHHTLLCYFFTVFISQSFVLCDCVGVPLLPPYPQSVFMSWVGDKAGRHTDLVAKCVSHRTDLPSNPSPDLPTHLLPSFLPTSLPLSLPFPASLNDLHKPGESIEDFPDGPAFKNLSANAVDMGSIPGLGRRSHMPWSS